MSAEKKKTATECCYEHKYFVELCRQGALKLFLRLVVAHHLVKTLNVAFPFDLFIVQKTNDLGGRLILLSH